MVSGELEHRVASVAGALLLTFSELEVDIADVLNSSVEHLPRGGREISKNYPLNVSSGAEGLSKMGELLGIAVMQLAPLVTGGKFREVSELRNDLSHGKIISIAGYKQGFKLRLVRVVRIGGRQDGVQKVERIEKLISSSEITAAHKLTLKMIEEVKEVTDRVFNLNQGWPSYLYIRASGPRFATIMSGTHDA